MRRMMMSPKLSCDVWDGETRGPVPEAVNNVITITTGAQLAGFADAVNSGTTYAGVTVRLADDINLDDRDWIPIGRFFAYGNAGNRAFKGTFDGMGHTVRGLYVEFIDKIYGETPALFGYIDYADAAASSRSAVKAAAVSPAARAEADASLGLIGEAYDKVVAERTALYKSFGTPSAVSTRSVTPSYATGGTVKNLRVYGEVINNGGQGAAGVVCWNDGRVENCYFEGTITIEDNGSNRAYVGGICSVMGANTYIVNCVVGGVTKLTAKGGLYSYAGGILGHAYAMNSGYVENCTVLSGVSIHSYMDAGGIVGGFCHCVSNCTCASDNIRVSAIDLEGNDANPNPNIAGYFAGGIVGAFGSETNSYWLQTADYASAGDTYKLAYAIGTGTDVSRKKSALPALPAASLLLSKYEAERAAVKLKATIYPVESSEAGQGVAISGQGVAVTPTALPNGGVGVLSLSGAGTVTVTVGGAAAIGPSCEMAVR